ncbi:unnamed protein product, partial [Prorocentrum cordatum]
GGAEESLRPLELAGAREGDRWDADIARMQEGVRLLFSNAFKEAEEMFFAGYSESAVSRRLEPGEHDLSAEFAFNWALASMIRGIISLEDKQFDECLQRIRIASAAAQSARDAGWVGHSIIIGCCFALEGVILLLQRSFVRGTACLARSWFYLCKAERHCDDGCGLADDPLERREVSVVRSVSLFMCGVVGLVASLLPVSVGGVARFLAGVPVDREVAVRRLETCCHERGLLAPWSCAVALAYHVDIRYFLGEDIGPDDVRSCHQMLDWAVARHPGSMVFGMLQANLASLQHRGDDAMACIERCAEHLPEAPGLELVIHAQHAKLALLACRWTVAARHFEEAAGVNMRRHRRSTVPTLSFAAALCALRAGDEQVAQRCLERVREYEALEKRSWPPSDSHSFRRAAAYLEPAASPAERALAPLLDLLELLELKLHALRRMPAGALREMLQELSAPERCGAQGASPVDARRLRCAAELQRLLGHEPGAVRQRLDAASAAARACGCGAGAEEVARDAVEALVHYSRAEVHLSLGEVADARACCQGMHRAGRRAELWISIAFKAHSLEQRALRLDTSRRGGPLQAQMGVEGAIAAGSPVTKRTDAPAFWLCCRRRRQKAE